MTSWVLTKGLQNLRAQVDAVFPNRDRSSDGTIGDTAHQAGISGHDPDDVPGSHAEWNGDPDTIPEVRAWDMDNNLAPGFDCQLLVDHVRALPAVSTVLRYIIYNRKIYEAANGWKPRAYIGASQHTEHVHFSGAYLQSADNDNSYDYQLEELPVALTNDDKKWIVEQIAAVTAFDKPQVDGTPNSKLGRLVLTQGIPNGTRAGTPRDVAWKVLEDLGVEVVALRAKVAELTAAVTAVGK